MHSCTVLMAFHGVSEPLDGNPKLIGMDPMTSWNREMTLPNRNITILLV